MDLNIIKTELLTKNTAITKAEVGIESDIVLPDACGDIERILKCTLSPRISGKRMEGNRLEVRGTAFLRLTYLSENGKICSFETQVPFSKSQTLEGYENCFVFIEPECDYINCRAVSRRRFEMRAALSLNIRICTRKPISVITDIEGAECRKKDIAVTLPVAEVCDDFTINEEYSVSAPIETVIKMVASTRLMEKKIISGKALIKGSVCAEVTYLSEGNDKPLKESFDIPISQVMSLEGAEEGDDLCITLNLLKLELTPLGDKNEISLEATIEVCAEVVREEHISAVCDAYLTACECKTECEKKDFCELEKNISKEHTHTISLDSLGGEASEIYAEIKNAAPYITDSGEIIMNCEAVLTAVINYEGEIQTREMSVPLSFSVAASESFRGGGVWGSVCLISAELIRGKNDAELKLCAKVLVKKTCSHELLSDFSAFEEMPHKKTDDTAIIIFFGERGEDIWDIAKRYNTSAEAILRQNELNSLVLEEDKKLIIPIV